MAHAVALSSCTAALHLAYLAAGVGPGDEVIVPAITFVASAAAVRYCGGTPVMADVTGSHDLGLDPEDVERPHHASAPRRSARSTTAATPPTSSGCASSARRTGWR